ncbi:hypothetical protein MTO96_006133 [Rhipicephalus appendiculatus]
MLLARLLLCLVPPQTGLADASNTHRQGTETVQTNPVCPLNYIYSQMTADNAAEIVQTHVVDPCKELVNRHVVKPVNKAYEQAPAYIQSTVVDPIMGAYRCAADAYDENVAKPTAKAAGSFTNFLKNYGLWQDDDEDGHKGGDQKGKEHNGGHEGHHEREHHKGGEPKIGEHKGGEHKGEDHKGEDHKGGEHKGEEHKGGEHKGGEHKGGDHKGGEHKAGEHKGGEHKGEEHKGGDHKGGEHKGEEHKGGDHKGGEHKGEEHKGGDHKGGEHKDVEHKGGDHKGGEHKGGEHKGEEHKGVDHKGGAKEPEHHKSGTELPLKPALKRRDSLTLAHKRASDHGGDRSPDRHTEGKGGAETGHKVKFGREEVHTLPPEKKRNKLDFNEFVEDQLGRMVTTSYKESKELLDTMMKEAMESQGMEEKKQTHMAPEEPHHGKTGGEGDWKERCRLGGHPAREARIPEVPGHATEQSRARPS